MPLGEWGSVVRIGLIELSTSVALTAEVATALPPQIGAVFTRVELPGGAASPEAIEAMARSERLESAARELGDARVDVVAFACTTGSLIGGLEFERRLSERLENAAGVPVTTTARALLAGLAAIGAKRVGVGTPYVESLNERERDFLVQAGFEVSSIRGLGIESDAEIAEVPEGEVRELARSVAASADAVFLSCTNMPTLSVLDDLERELGLPVFSSNAATLWHALTLAGHTPQLAGCGSLLAGRWPADGPDPEPTTKGRSR